MKEYSSFISEHTAEFVLIPQLTSILKHKFKDIIPIFPWMTREGNIFSKYIHHNDIFQIVGLYPKRPKINLKERKLLIKINDEFINGANEAKRINIPMLLGCPLAKNLWELNQDTKCIWIKLSNKTKIFYNIEYNDEISSIYNLVQYEEVLNNDDEILNFIIDESNDLTFENFIQGIRSIKENSSTLYFMNFGSYKPIYFLLRK